jgi:hypothetical protein
MEEKIFWVSMGSEQDLTIAVLPLFCSSFRLLRGLDSTSRILVHKFSNTLTISQMLCFIKESSKGTIQLGCNLIANDNHNSTRNPSLSTTKQTPLVYHTCVHAFPNSYINQDDAPLSLEATPLAATLGRAWFLCAALSCLV